MAQTVKAKPDGYPTLTPYLVVRDGSAAIEFYQKVFGARLRMRLGRPDGKVGHAELGIGDSLVMLADEAPEHGAVAPAADGKGSSMTLHLYVDNADAVFQTATGAGAAVVRAIETMFYGDRLGTVRDPFGHVWHISTHVEDVSPEESQRRVSAMKT